MGSLGSANETQLQVNRRQPGQTKTAATSRRVAGAAAATPVNAICILAKPAPTQCCTRTSYIVDYYVQRGKDVRPISHSLILSLSFSLPLSSVSHLSFYVQGHAQTTPPPTCAATWPPTSSQPHPPKQPTLRQQPQLLQSCINKAQLGAGSLSCWTVLLAQCPCCCSLAEQQITVLSCPRYTAANCCEKWKQKSRSGKVTIE